MSKKKSKKLKISERDRRLFRRILEKDSEWTVEIVPQKYRSVTYTYSEAQRIVRCTIDTDCCRFESDLSAHLCNRRNHVNRFVFTHQKCTYTGVATCAPDDTWDLKYGKALAYKRAYAGLYAERLQILYDIMADLDQKKDAVMDYMNRQDLLWDKVWDKVAALDHKRKEKEKENTQIAETETVGRQNTDQTDSEGSGEN